MLGFGIKIGKINVLKVDWTQEYYKTLIDNIPLKIYHCRDKRNFIKTMLSFTDDEVNAGLFIIYHNETLNFIQKDFSLKYFNKINVLKIVHSWREKDSYNINRKSYNKDQVVETISMNMRRIKMEKLKNKYNGK